MASYNNIKFTKGTDIVYIASKLEIKVNTVCHEYGVSVEDIDELEKFLHSISDNIMSNAKLAMDEHNQNKDINYVNYEV